MQQVHSVAFPILPQAAEVVQSVFWLWYEGCPVRARDFVILQSFQRSSETQEVSGVIGIGGCFPHETEH
jgi:hypothetical protein